VLFVNDLFFQAITFPKRMAENEDRKSKRSQNNQKTPERDISEEVKLKMCTSNSIHNECQKNISILICNFTELYAFLTSSEFH